jgi:serine/threonine protein phosphatase PrpC
MQNLEDYENQLKGKLKSYLSCIPDMVCFDIKVDTDDFVILSTDGIFESMDIFQVVPISPSRPISSRNDTISWSCRRTRIRSSVESLRTAR